MSAQKLTQGVNIEVVETFIQWREAQSFDTSNPDWINCRNANNLTPLQASILMFEEPEIGETREECVVREARAPMILNALLALGADPTLCPPYNAGTPVEEQNTGNPIAFASSRGAIKACYMMYKHNPAIVNAPTGPDGILDAFAAAAFQLDNELPEDESARSFEITRKEACENLIKLLVVEMGYDVNTLLSNGDVPLECMVLNNRPIATKLLIKLGGDIGATKGMNILQLAACAGANQVLPVIKELCPFLFGIKKDINSQPLILAMVNSENPDNAARYKDAIQFLATEQYSDGLGIIKILSIAVSKNLLFANEVLVDAWATKFDSLVGKTPLMWAMDNNRNSACQKIISYISELDQETRDQMPEFGKGLLALDDAHLNMHYTQFALDVDSPNGIRRCAELVPNVAGREPYSEPTGILGAHTHHTLGPCKVVHTNRDAFNFACSNAEIKLAQSISENPNLGTFNDNTRQDHIHYAVRFANKETVDNIARKESDTIDNVDCFMRSPLDYAALRWVAATTEPQALEAKYIISALCHYGANSEKVLSSITNKEFKDIFEHSEEIYASWRPSDVESVASGLSAVHLDEVA